MTSRGSDVFLKADLRALLQALLLASEAQARVSGGTRSAEFAAGFRVAIGAMAAALDCGIVDAGADAGAKTSFRY